MDSHHSATIILFALLPLLFISSSSAYLNFYVGGKDGWVLDPTESYDHWAGRNRFQVNDTLVFKYKEGEDSVFQVTKEDYYSCDRRNPLKRMTSGSSVFQFPQSGPFYFISGKEGKCEKGQKLIVVVLAIRPKPVVQPPKSPSPAAETPTTSPVSSPSPMSQPPATSPVSQSPGPMMKPPTWAPQPSASPVSPPKSAPSPSPVSPPQSAPTPAPSQSPKSPSPAPYPPNTSVSPAPSKSQTPTQTASPPPPGSDSKATPPPPDGQVSDINTPPPSPSSSWAVAPSSLWICVVSVAISSVIGVFA